MNIRAGGDRIRLPRQAFSYHRFCLSLLPMLVVGFVPVCPAKGDSPTDSDIPAAAATSPRAATPSASTNVTNPNASVSGSNNHRWNLDAGYLLGLPGDKARQFYYKLQADGRTLAQDGSVLPLTNIGAPLVPPDAAPTSGPNQYSLRLERGDVKLAGAGIDTIFNAIGIRPLRTSVGPLKDLRGALEVSGRVDGKQENLAFGLETPPAHPLNWLSKTGPIGSMPNWIVVGLNGESEIRSATTGGNQDLGQVTYRVFTGFAGGYTPDKTLQTSVDQVLAAAPTFVAAKALADKFLSKPGQPPPADIPPPGIAFIIEAEREYLNLNPQAGGKSHPEFPTDEVWKIFVTTYLGPYNQSVTHPKYAIWFDDAGWYTFTKVVSESRYNNLVGVSVMWWLRPVTGDERWLTLRYENGNGRATPAIHRNFVSLSFGGIL